MKITARGFTLVELMIVIAIIGILAAALFPSVTSYLARGRDTSRTAALKELSTAIAAYAVDKTSLPDGVNAASDTSRTAGAKLCVSSGAIADFIPKMPIDPNKSTLNCGVAGAYGYGTGNVNGGTTTVALSAQLENKNGGNTASGIETWQGFGITDASLKDIDAMVKASGSGYVIRN